MTQSVNHTEKKIFYSRLLTLVLPMALQNFMTALVGASDAIMLGLLNQDSLSAVSLANQIQFILTIVLNACSTGEAVLSAQYWGKKDTKTVEDVLGISLLLSTSASFLIFIGSLFFPAYLMQIYTNDPVLIQLGCSYLRNASWSYLFLGISHIYLCIMKNTERTFRSTIYGSTAVVLNIILNAILIFGLFGMPRLGIIGAAIATSIARGVELSLIFIENFRYDLIKIRILKILRPNRPLFRDYIYYTWPAMANQMVWGIAFSMFSVIMGHLGNDAVAANSIVGIAKHISICFCFGLGSGAGIMIGNELGRGNLDYAKTLGDRLMKLSVLAGVITCVIFTACIPLIMKCAGVLTPTASRYLKMMLFISSYYMIGKSFSATLIGGVFNAGGDTRFGLICDTINMWGVILPLGFLSAFVFHAPVPVVFFLLNLDEFTKMPAEYWYFKKYRWLRNITR